MALMPRKTKTGSTTRSSDKTAVASIKYPATRKNIPPAGLEAQGLVKETEPVRYAYNPHLPPVLRSSHKPADTDVLTELLATAQERALTADEADLLAQAVRRHEPWLEWSGKREKPWFEVEPVALHMHERVSTQAIVRALAREDAQRDLFADPQLDYAKAVQFYRHDVDWANRMILGDSLQVMASLAHREDLTGKVQMIYLDPPYGIKFSSNFQPELGRRDVKDREQRPDATSRRWSRHSVTPGPSASTRIWPTSATGWRRRENCSATPAASSSRSATITCTAYGA